MKEFVVKGSITLENVTFYMYAKDLEAARAKAGAGEFDSYDISEGYVTDGRLSPSSIRENS